MQDIIKLIHSAIGSDSTIKFVLLIATLFGLGLGVLAGGFAWLIDKGYKNSIKEQAQQVAYYRPDRRLSTDQEHLLYLALRDAVQNVPQGDRRVYFGSVDGDVESRRFSQLYLQDNFANAGWQIELFTRHWRRKEGDAPYPGFIYADVSVTSTFQQGSLEYKQQSDVRNAMLTALRGAGIDAGEGLMDDKDELHGKAGFVIWVNPKKDGPK